MSEAVPSTSIEGQIQRTLLEHDAFLRAVARGLLGDADRVEDAVQDAYTSALTHPPRIDAEPGSAPHRSATRSWLATVVMNHARNRLRNDARRHERERVAARAESQRDDDDVAERLRVQRRVMNAVESLREPYRTAVYLRYAEGLPPRAIAERTAAPVETVRSRVQRGLEMLRRDLDREFGDRSSWCAALLPYLAPRASWTTTAVPIAAWLAVVVAVAAIPICAWYGLNTDRAALSALPSIEPLGAQRLSAPDSPERPTNSSRRAAADARSAVASARPAEDAASRRVRVRVVDGRGEPLTGVRIEDSGATGDDGWLAVPREHREAAVVDVASGAALRVAERAEFDDGTVELRVDVAATFTLEASDVDLEGAEISLASSDGTLADDSRAHTGARPFVRFTRVPTRTLLESGGDAAWVLSAITADKERSASTRVHAVRGTAHEPVELRFEPAHRVDLRVTSAAGAALRDVRVDSRSRALAGGEPGAWTLLGGVDTPIEVAISARGHAPRRVTIPSGASVHEVSLEPRGAYEFAVHVASASGREDMELALELRPDDRDAQLERSETRTLRVEGSPRGRVDVAFEDVPPGTYTLIVNDGGPWPFDPPRQRVEVPGDPARLVRQDAARPILVTARARDPRGRPIERARCAVLVDRYGLGRRDAIASQGAIPVSDVAHDGATRATVLPQQRFWWLVEADGHTSVMGDDRDVGRHGDRVEIDVRLVPSWRCELWIADRSGAGSIAALAGVRLTTQAGRELATSLADGRIVLDLPYDPGQLRIECADRRVIAWEGFANGRRRAELPVHRVLLESDP